MNRTYATPLSPYVQVQGALPRLQVQHPAATAEVFLHGAHLTHWQPAGHEPVLFMSSNSAYAPDTAFRGGVPICFPWFGPHSTDPNLPAHGFGRLSDWQLVSQDQDADHVWLHLQLSSTPRTHDLWGADFVADFRLTIGKELQMKLSVSNTGAAPITFEEALHTYYRVSDVRQVSVAGLKGATYVDKPDGQKRKTEANDVIRFTGETDRVYLQTSTATCVIDDPGMKRQIIVEKTGSQATVVWNPGEARAAVMKDIGPANWTPFVCVETANCGETAVTLAPGRTHEMAARIKVEAR